LEGKNIWLVGGGELIKHFYSNNLIDEYIITVLPVILGDGIPLFVSGRYGINLECTNVKRFPNGFVELIFRKLTQN
jgi:dihydrofolate reductase